jgi:hypothetical protein
MLINMLYIIPRCVYWPVFVYSYYFCIDFCYFKGDIIVLWLLIKENVKGSDSIILINSGFVDFCQLYRILNNYKTMFWELLAIRGVMNISRIIGKRIYY